VAGTLKCWAVLYACGWQGDVENHPSNWTPTSTAPLAN
jgi:hypothetical protein